MESFKMDKWDELVTRVKQGILAQEPDAALAGGLQLFAEFGRTIEQAGADLDRIATVLERAFEPGVQHAEVPSEHDL
jgi:hypothetical protein